MLAQFAYRATYIFICFSGLASLHAQHVHIQTLSGCAVDVDEKEPGCCCDDYPHYRQWRDPVAEEVAEDSSWPSRRNDELSDILTR